MLKLIGFIALILAAWITLIVIASLIAVLPFFLLGLVGHLLDRARSRHHRGSKAPPTSEEEIWRESRRSLASFAESLAEKIRRAA